MIELELSDLNRKKIAKAFKDIKRVDIAIDSVIEGQMGKAFTNDASDPTIFKLQLGPFCYFAGDFENDLAENMIKQMEPYTLIMACPKRAIELAKEFHGKKLIQFPRYSFSSEKIRLEQIETLLDDSPFQSNITKINRSLLEKISGHPDHYLDISSYKSIDDFLKRGTGYVYIENDKLSAVAFASLISNTGIEVSIYVEPDYRRKGVATVLGCTLIKDCLERNIDPHWDAANIESCTLAEKLGYYQTGTYYAYYIKE